MSNKYEYTGTVVHLSDIQQISEKFSKCELVLTDRSEKYPQEVPFVFGGQMADTPSKEQLQVGDEVKVAFNLRGREWKGRWFPENSAWKLEVLQRANPVKDVTGEPENYADEVLDEEPPF